MAYHDADEDGANVIRTNDLKETGWNVWHSIAKFCVDTEISLQAIVVDLRFSLLD